MDKIEKLKILIVEDELPLLQALIDKFNKKGFTVVIAKNGDEGLASAFQEHPDLILLDLVMPRMGGMTMLERLRLDAWGKDVPVIILTNLSDNEAVSEAAKEFVFDYLVKADWKIDNIVEKVKEKLGVK
jgi:DNA-binding response OmpR family regulator